MLAAKRLPLLAAIVFVILLLSSCAAAKSKKCNCPTFGNNHKHAQTIPVKKGKDS